jgi:Xaa-Pro aminopeptidase
VNLKRLKNLRELMVQEDIDYYLVSMADEFGNEYVPEHNNRLKYITGFKGSAGFAIIGLDRAVFFTDGRYSIQAKKEVDEKLFEILDYIEISPAKWLKNNISNDSKIGFDANIFTILEVEKFEAEVGDKSELVALDKNLVDEIWDERPEYIASKAFVISSELAGKSTKEKLDDILDDFGSDYLLVTDPISICWLLNIRGRDLPSTPIVFCYALVNKNGEVSLYVDDNTFDDEIKKQIYDKVTYKKFDEVFSDIELLESRHVSIDKSQTPLIFKELFYKLSVKVREEKNPIILAKALKNESEIDNIRKTHVKDGVALVKFICWLEKEISAGNSPSEVECCEKLLGFRKEQEGFIYASFDTIAGYAANGAIIHYKPAEESCAELKDEGLFLLDSGGQYFGGTTDITRTIALGKPTEEQKHNFTLVLKGHVSIATAKVPKGSSGTALDPLARQFLWAEGKDYAHGTGHGVGYILNVHEGPQNISKRGYQELLPGMVISNEPGYYEEGEYGIRIESLILVKESEDNFLEFETLSVAPIDLELIDKELLTNSEKNWINDYHKKVFDLLSPRLNEEEAIWLKEKTKEIS